MEILHLWCSAVVRFCGANGLAQSYSREGKAITSLWISKEKISKCQFYTLILKI